MKILAVGSWLLFGIVNGVVSNMPEFQSAFGCKEGDPMVREQACRIW